MMSNDHLWERVVSLSAIPDVQGQRKLYQLVVPASLERVADVRGFIDSIGLDSIFTRERIFDMKVAISEAVANAIEHANAEVRVWLWLMSDRVVVEVMNKGDFGVQQDGASCERRRGYGLKLMVSLADEVTFVGARRGTIKVRLTFQHRAADAETDKPFVFLSAAEALTDHARHHHR